MMYGTGGSSVGGWHNGSGIAHIAGCWVRRITVGFVEIVWQHGSQGYLSSDQSST